MAFGTGVSRAAQRLREGETRAAAAGPARPREGQDTGTDCRSERPECSSVCSG